MATTPRPPGANPGHTYEARPVSEHLTPELQEIHIAAWEALDAFHREHGYKPRFDTKGVTWQMDRVSYHHLVGSMGCPIIPTFMGWPIILVPMPNDLRYIKLSLQYTVIIK